MMRRYFRLRSELSGAIATKTAFCAWQCLQSIRYIYNTHINRVLIVRIKVISPGRTIV